MKIKLKMKMEVRLKIEMKMEENGKVGNWEVRKHVKNLGNMKT